MTTARQRLAVVTDPEVPRPGPLAHTLEDVAQHLTISVRHLRRLIRTGQLKARRIGSRVIVLNDDLQSYLRSLPSA